MIQCYWINARDKLGLLSALMHELSGMNSRLILEGKLKEFDFSDIESEKLGEEYRCDSGNDVISLKLTEDFIKPILKQIQPFGKYVKKISHIQIRLDDEVQVLIGDNFHNECISVGPLVSKSFLFTLMDKGIIRGFLTHAEAKSRYPWFNAYCR